MLVMPFLYTAFFVDSTLYTVDPECATIGEIAFQKPIIDYVADDFLYLNTDDYLYKIDPARTQIIDKTPLPLRFNHILLQQQEIVLISTDEIIVLDRGNLAFKSGIGIERGDHRPIVKIQRVNARYSGRNIYLISDAGAHSTLRILDLGSGKTIKRTTVQRMTDFIYDPRDMNFIGLETNKDLSIYDLTMKRLKRLHLDFEVQNLVGRAEGFSVVSEQGIFFYTKSGEMIDFQPIPKLQDVCGSVILTEHAICWLDTLTLRVDGWLMNHQKIVRLFLDSESKEVVGLTPSGKPYLIRNTPGSMISLARQRKELTPAMPVSIRYDSLWYLQLGAFTNPTNALLMYGELRKTGLPVMIDTADLYRVKFGGFTDKPTALYFLEKTQLDGWLVFEHRTHDETTEVFYIGTEEFVVDKGVVRKE
jgi:hypothetical protein